MTWEIVAGIITLIGCLIAIFKVVTPLTSNIAKLNTTIENIVKTTEKLVIDDEKHDKKLEDHEVRISVLEHEHKN